jgi:hypothetical protein
LRRRSGKTTLFQFISLLLKCYQSASGRKEGDLALSMAASSIQAPQINVLSQTLGTGCILFRKVDGSPLLWSERPSEYISMSLHPQTLGIGMNFCLAISVPLLLSAYDIFGRTQLLTSHSILSKKARKKGLSCANTAMRHWAR